MTFTDQVTDLLYFARKIDRYKTTEARKKPIRQLQMMVHSLDVVLSERIKMEDATYTTRS